MGYSEVPCHLCGVPFNIGRIRTREEPRIHAWTGTGDWDDARTPATLSWVHGLLDWGSRSHCSTEKTGCYLVHRGDPNRPPASPLAEAEDLEQSLDASEDDDWAPKEGEGEDEDVMEEWESDADVLDEASEGEHGADPMDLDLEDDNLYADFIKNCQRKYADLTEDVFKSFSDPSEMTPGDLFDGKSLGEYEHVAGPSCMVSRGYSGHRISAREMYGCKTLQCLVPKESHWRPESDDLQLERESRHFLSGLSDHMPSRDMSRPSFAPRRHSLESVDADVHDYMDHPAAMPFHPWCFEIFIRQSSQRFGRIDVDGLMDWRDYQHNPAERHRRGPKYDHSDAFSCIHRHPDLEKGREQWWIHVSGHEYLAANAVLVPDLPAILHAASSPECHGQDGVFEVTEHDLGVQGVHHDPFLQLSSELRLAVLELLDGTSVASLRLSSRAFRQLPQSIFYTLIRKELPSLWEAAQDTEGDPTPYFWTLLTQREISKYIDNPEDPAQKEFHDDICTFRAAIREDMPELYDDWLAAEPDWRTFRNAPPWPPVVPERIRLKKGATDWHRLYVNIKKGLKHGGLKGLKNRERIWTDVGFIIDMIAEARDNGHIS